jgi:hypothetical protein
MELIHGAKKGKETRGVVASGRPAHGEGVVEAGDDGGDGVGLQHGDGVGPVLLVVTQAQMSILPRTPTQTDINHLRVHIAAVSVVALGRESAPGQDRGGVRSRRHGGGTQSSDRLDLELLLRPVVIDPRSRALELHAYSQIDGEEEMEPSGELGALRGKEEEEDEASRESCGRC